MKKRLFGAAGLLSIMLTLAACGESEGAVVSDVKFDPLPTVVENGEAKDANLAEGEELMGMASSQDEAQAIADQYGITLVLYAQGVATYHTEEDPSEVIQRGKDNGWPALELNQVQSLID